MGLLDRFNNNPSDAPQDLSGAGSQDETPFDELLALDMLADCIGLDVKGTCKTARPPRTIYELDWLLSHLPGVKVVSDLKQALIWGRGLQFEDEAENKRLQKWLDKTNDLRQANGVVLQDAIRVTQVEGHAAIRQFSDDKSIVNVHNKHWRIITTRSGGRGRKKILFYYVDENKKHKDWKEVKDLTAEQLDDLIGIKKVKQAQGRDRFIIDREAQKENDKKGMYYLLPSELTHLSQNTDTLYGKSPFLNDRLRIQLIAQAYLANIDDLAQGSFGTLLLRVNNHVKAANSAGISKDEARQAPIEARKKLNKTINTQIESVATKLVSGNANDKVISMNSDFLEDDPYLIPRLSNGKDYLEFLEGAVGTTANIMNIHPTLLGLQNTAYQTSIGPIIDLTLQKVIVPAQKRTISQIEPMLRKIIDAKSELSFEPFSSNSQKDLVDISKIAIEAAKGLADMGASTDTIYDYLDQFEIPVSDETKANSRRVINRSYVDYDEN